MNVNTKKLIVIPKNNAKERMHNAALKVNELCQTLKANVSEEHDLFIQSATERSRRISSSKRKNILYVNSMNFRQHELKETTSKLQPLMLNQALLTLRMLH